MIEDKDKDVERRDYARLRAERFERPSMVLIEKCIDAEEGSVYKMALRHLNASEMGGMPVANILINMGIIEESVNDFDGYHVLDDINAAILGAYIAGYMAAFMGGDKDEQ
jgi:hypothetical protein